MTLTTRTQTEWLGVVDSARCACPTHGKRLCSTSGDVACAVSVAPTPSLTVAMSWTAASYVVHVAVHAVLSHVMHAVTPHVSTMLTEGMAQVMIFAHAAYSHVISFLALIVEAAALYLNAGNVVYQLAVDWVDVNVEAEVIHSEYLLLLFWSS